MRWLLPSVALILALAACRGDDGPDDGSVSENCDDYARQKAESAEITDRYVVGVVSVGFLPGKDSREAARILKTLGTSFVMPLPFRDMAVLCVQPGREDEWIARVRTMDWVEWIHREGVNPFDTLED